MHDDEYLQIETDGKEDMYEVCKAETLNSLFLSGMVKEGQQVSLVSHRCNISINKIYK